MIAHLESSLFCSNKNRDPHVEHKCNGKFAIFVEYIGEVVFDVVTLDVCSTIFWNIYILDLDIYAV